MYSDLPHIVLTPNPACTSKIQAIKDIRAATGLGLKQAKEIADKLWEFRSFDSSLQSRGQSYSLYADEYGAYTESDVQRAYDSLNASKNLYADLRSSVPVAVRDADPLRGAAFEGSVLAVSYMTLRDGDVNAALSDVRTIATVTNDPTFRAAAVVLEEAQGRLNGKDNTPLLAIPYIPTA